MLLPRHPCRHCPKKEMFVLPLCGTGHQKCLGLMERQGLEDIPGGKHQGLGKDYPLGSLCGDERLRRMFSISTIVGDRLGAR